MKIIFLDFDGVLHSEIIGHKPFELQHFFASAIYNTDCQIVLSTSWRIEKKLENILPFLCEEISSRIIGTTPVFKAGLKPGGRFKEIQSYVREFKINSNDWIAIDDSKILFPEKCSNLLLCDNKKGFKEEEMRKLREWLELSPKKHIKIQ